MPADSGPFREAIERFGFQPRTHVVFGEGCVAQLGELARGLGFRRTLLVADPGLMATGHAPRASAILENAGIETAIFHDFDANPDSRMVEVGRRAAEAARVDSIVAIGGGSSLDCAKGINFLLTNGGEIKDYWGFGKTTTPMLPAVGIPTTAGTGSEAQSYALISDAVTHVKMACGDHQAAFRIALLDPLLTLTQPPQVTAVAGYDALSHAVEARVTSKRNEISDLFARSAWRRLAGNYRRVIEHPHDVAARGEMLLGAHEAGVAIEQSMLGATHACANPLTARYGTPHGIAIAVMLPPVVRWNAAVCGDAYGLMLDELGMPVEPNREAGHVLAGFLADLARIGGLPATLHDLDVPHADVARLSEEAARQWTGTFNPRPFDSAAARELYERAFTTPPPDLESI